MAERDLYAVLSVARDASEDKLRRSYRKLARETHPDVNPGDHAAEERFKELGFAYEVLSDPEKRRTYDEFGHEGLAQGFDPEQARAYRQWSQGGGASPFGAGFGMHFEDLFESLFEQRQGGRREAVGRDLQSEVEVDFLDAVMGREVRVRVKGKGGLRVTLPAGAVDGTRIRLAGQGAIGAGSAGDLYLTLRVRPHSYFSRKGADLFVDIPVTLPELVLSATIEVPTPDGPVSMKIPSSSVNNRKLRLRGKGGRVRGSEKRGDLYAQLVLELPPSSDELDALARESESLYATRDLRAHLK